MNVMGKIRPQLYIISLLLSLLNGALYYFNDMQMNTEKCKLNYVYLETKLDRRVIAKQGNM